jgi:hypothetical protein
MEDFQKWFQRLPKDDKLILAAEIAWYTKQKDKTVGQMLNYKFESVYESISGKPNRSYMPVEYGTSKATGRYRKETPGQEGLEILQSPYNQIVADNTEITFAIKKGKKEKGKDIKDGYKDGDSSHGDKNYDSFKTGVKSTDKKRRAQQNRQKDMADDDPKAYKDLPGDKKARAKGLPPSKFTTKYKQMYGEMMEHLTFEDYVIENKGQAQKALKKKSDATGVPMSILNKVFDRGYAAWKTGHKPGTTPVQWGLARVNSFLVGGPVWQKFDSDQAKLARKAGFSPKR